jgi:hypothetical protein
MPAHQELLRGLQGTCYAALISGTLPLLQPTSNLFMIPRSAVVHLQDITWQGVAR